MTVWVLRENIYPRWLVLRGKERATTTRLNEALMLARREDADSLLAMIAHKRVSKDEPKFPNDERWGELLYVQSQEVDL